MGLSKSGYKYPSWSYKSLPYLLITRVSKSHDPPSRGFAGFHEDLYSGGLERFV